MPIDPVCKMHVEIDSAAASQDYHSQTVYFCSLDCKKKFEKEPGRYMDDMTDQEKIAV